MMQLNRDGSATFISDTNPQVTQNATGTPAQIDAAYLVFLAANPPPKPTVVTRQQFLGLLTSAEQGAIAAAAQTQPAVFIWMMNLTDSIDLTLPLTQQGVQAMVSAGLLTSARATTILGGG